MNYFAGRINNIIDAHDLPDINCMLQELSPDSAVVDKKTLCRFCEHANTYIILACDEEDLGEKGFAKERGRIVGMVLVNFLRKWTGVYGFIDDVVVRKKNRGKKYGIIDKLLSEADTLALHLGARYVDLTCGRKPERDAAHRVYLRHGYVPRDSIPYRKKY